MLKYYADEKEVFRQEREMKISDAEAELVYQKLAKKYKLSQRLEFYGNRQSGSCSSCRVKLSHNPSIAILSHEVAHAIQYAKFKKKYGYINGNPNLKKHRWHTKKHQRIMRKVCDYINKNIDQWRTGQKERSERKCIGFERKLKLEEQRMQERKTPQFKLIKIRELIKKWEGKRKRAENKLKKLQKMEKRYIMQVQNKV